MAIPIVYIGDTFTFHSEFYDINNSLIDSDDLTAECTIYNNETLSVVVTGDATRISLGIYEYDWTVIPGDGITYILEMKAIFSSKPQLKRMKVKAKFRPA